MHCRTSESERVKIMKCSECGKEFKPKRYNQLTCSSECARLRNCRRVKSNYAKYGQATGPKRCTICGKVIDYEKENLRRYATMHEECLMGDLLDTLRRGDKLTDKQYNRMIARSLTTRDLIQMIARERENEQVRDMW